MDTTLEVFASAEVELGLVIALTVGLSAIALLMMGSAIGFVTCYLAPPKPSKAP